MNRPNIDNYKLTNYDQLYAYNVELEKHCDELEKELAASRRQLSAVPSELQKIKRIVDIVDSVAFWQYPNDKNLVSVNLKKLEMELMERGIAG